MSSDQETSIQQLSRLAAHRRTLAHLLTQQAQFSAGHIPAHVANAIAEARTNIARIKAYLREIGVQVDDERYDDPPPEVVPIQRGGGGDDETIAQQLELLAIHRHTLAHLLQQSTQFGGEVFAPPQTANGIAEARQQIRHVKATLRGIGVQVEDEPNDETPAQVELTQRVSSGAASGDKVAGDKVAGDKWTVSAEGGDYAWVEAKLLTTLPLTLHLQVPRLARLFTDAASGLLPQGELQSRIESDPALEPALYILAGEQIVIGRAVITFGAQDQLGHIRIGEVVTANIGGGDKVMGDKRIIDTAGGDYAEGNIDRRQGAFVAGDTIYGNVMGRQIFQPSFAPAFHPPRAPVTDFAGREREVNQIVQALRQASGNKDATAVYIIRGPDSVGKTELAYIVAYQLRDDFPEGQSFLDMRGSSDTPLAPEEALQTLLFPEAMRVEQPPQFLQQIYWLTLAGQRVLIIADDVKDVAQLKGILPPPGSALLVTSRNKLNLPGAMTLDLDMSQRDILSSNLTRLLAWYSGLAEHNEAQFITVGFFGLALFLFAVGIALIAIFAPFQRIIYVVAPAQPPSLLLNPSLWTVLIGSLVAAFIGVRARTLFRGMLAVLLLVILVLSVVVLLNKPSTVAHAAELAQSATPVSSTPVPTVAATQGTSTAQTALASPQYGVELHATGPETLRFGTSARVVFTISVVEVNKNNKLTDPIIPLLAASGYTATVSVQPGNFDIDTAVVGRRDEKTLSLSSPAQWTWVITPKEKKFGSQELAFDVFIFDQKRTSVPIQTQSIKVYITDPLGLPAWVDYSFGYIGAVLGALGILPVLYARYLKPKQEEKREPVPSTSTASPTSLNLGGDPTGSSSVQPPAFTARLTSDTVPDTPSVMASSFHPSEMSSNKMEVGGIVQGAQGLVDPKQRTKRRNTKGKAKDDGSSA